MSERDLERIEVQTDVRTGRPQGHMEPERYGQSTVDLSYRRNRTRDLRREFRGLPLSQRRRDHAHKEPAPSWGFHSDGDYRGCRLDGHGSGDSVSRPTLSSLLNGKADLSGNMALRIEKALGVKTDTLMRMQSSYDIAQTRKREKQIRVPRIFLVGCHALA